VHPESAVRAELDLISRQLAQLTATVSAQSSPRGSPSPTPTKEKETVEAAAKTRVLEERIAAMEASHARQIAVVQAEADAKAAAAASEAVAATEGKFTSNLPLLVMHGPILTDGLCFPATEAGKVRQAAEKTRFLEQRMAAMEAAHLVQLGAARGAAGARTTTSAGLVQLEEPEEAEELEEVEAEEEEEFGFDSVMEDIEDGLGFASVMHESPVKRGGSEDSGGRVRRPSINVSCQYTSNPPLLVICRSSFDRCL